MSTEVPRILVVEDEALIRMMVCELVQEIGCEVVAEAGDVQEARSLLRNVQFDFALLDLNLNGERTESIARELLALHVPFAFVSGYENSALPPELREVPILAKPFSENELRDVLQRTVLFVRTASLSERAPQKCRSSNTLARTELLFSLGDRVPVHARY